MSNFNKVVTNLQKSLSNAENDNLSQTLSAVRTAGGGGGGTSYGGDGIYIEIVGNNTITLTTTAAEKLNRAIPTTVAELTDSGDYAQKTEIPDSITDFADTSSVIYSYINETTSAIEQQLNFKQNKLQFDLNAKGEISAIGSLNNTTALVGANGITGDYYSASNPSGFITSSVGGLDNFYSKTDTSSKNEIANAFDNIPKYILNGDSNITATSAQDGKNIRWDLAVNAKPVVTDTTLTGENGIYTHTTTKSGEWCVELVQSAYAAINDVQNKLDTTVAAQTYQPKGDYVSSTDITDMATQTWVGTQGYLTEVPSEYVTDTELQTTLGGYATNALVQNTSANITALIPSTEGLASETDLQIVSAGVDYVSAHAITAHQPLTDYYTKSQTSGASELSTEFGKYALKSEIPTVPTKVSDLTDSANYYKTTETSSKNELSTEFAKYLTNTQYNTDSATFALKNEIPTTVAQLTDSGNYYKKTETSSKTEIANALNTKVDKPTSTQTGKLVYDGDTSAWVTLPAGTTTIVQGQGSVTANYDSISTYTISLLASAENALAGVNDKIDTTAVAQTYQTKADMTNYIAYTDMNSFFTPENGISADLTKRAGDVDNTYYFGLTQTAYNAITSVSSKLDTTAFSDVSGTFLTKSSADNDYAPKSVTATVNTLTAASAGWNNKVDKPTSLNDKYLVLRTDSNGAVSGWCDLQDQSYSKSEALGTFVATANIDTTTLSGDGKSVSTKLGVKTDVIATIDYVSGNYLPTSGGTVSGDIIVKSTGTNLLAVNTTATLMGQSRVNNLTDTTAIGTNWLGVNSNGGGFLKNVQGGNVGDLNGTSIQIDFAPNGNTAYGNITVNSQGNTSKVVHIPTASYDSMSSFDNTNGPNYMLRKTASGFDIGAAVINVTQLPAQTEANTYYFIYDT